MKKTFKLSHAKIKVPRLFERAKHDLRKYVKRERRKDLPDGADFWDFDCKFGITEEAASTVHLAELPAKVDEVEKQGGASFYVEILAKPGHRTKKAKTPPEEIGEGLFDAETGEPDPADESTP